MHGRPRKAPKENDAAEREKAERLRSLQLQFFHSHQNKIYTKEALEVSAKLLEINPEVYTAWNYRKIAVDLRLESESDPNSRKTILDHELRVVENALRQNPKSYGAWHHRKWVMKKGSSSIDHEFKLLDKFLKIDSRNFHGWNYRRFVAALRNATDQEELKYMTDKINTNFSNYSAWHNRSVLLSNLLRQKADGYSPKEDVLVREYELVDGALFTDPDDQSGWFYYLWLLDETTQTDIPVLKTFWPPHGSELIVTASAELGLYVSSPFKAFFPHSGLAHGTFPLVLHFNKSIEEFDNSFITVKTELFKNDSLVWEPLSTTRKGKSKSWVAYFSIPADIPKESNIYSIEVNLGHSLGILSSDSTRYSCPGQYSFTMNLQFVDTKLNEDGPFSQMLTWGDDEFCSSSDLDESFVEFCFPSDQTRDELSNQVASKWQLDTIENEITLFRDLLTYKIGKLTLGRLLLAHNMMTNDVLSTKKITNSEVLKLFDDLQHSDTTHASYYKDQYSFAFLDQATSSREALRKHCWHHKNIDNRILQGNVWLRLNNLSLSRVGFLERLLWVQMLDLSHNELQTIEGLEVLQLLTCLNLSNNKLQNFTALEPLRLLKFLRVLNISHNEIGAHPVDTTRYLCSSPLSNGRGFQMNMEEATRNSASHHYWEVILIFTDLFLIQLDLLGNPSYDDNCQELLETVIPSLKWLNGVLLR